MALPKSWNEIKTNPVFLVGVVLAIIGIGTAVYGKYGKGKTDNKLVWGGVAMLVTALAVAFGSTYIPPMKGDSNGDSEGTSRRVISAPTMVTGVTTPV